MPYVLVSQPWAWTSGPQGRLWRWNLATLVAVLLVSGASHLSARHGLVVIREALVAHRARTGSYPADLDALVGSELPALPPAGLPLVIRSYRYMPGMPGHAPILLFAYAEPFGRCVIDVESGHTFTID